MEFPWKSVGEHFKSFISMSAATSLPLSLFISNGKAAQMIQGSFSQLIGNSSISDYFILIHGDEVFLSPRESLQCSSISFLVLVKRIALLSNFYFAFRENILFQ